MNQNMLILRTSNPILYSAPPHLVHRMRIQTISINDDKGADQLRSN